MGESLGDILYIVFMVVALVVSVIIKAKKAPHEETPVPQSEMKEVESDEDFPTFSDWLSGKEERLNETETVVSPTPTKQPDNIPYTRMRSHLSESYHHTKRAEELKRSEGVPQTPPKIDEVELEASEWFNDPQDLRRAVIYSEILRRPSF